MKIKVLFISALLLPLATSFIPAPPSKADSPFHNIEEWQAEGYQLTDDLIDGVYEFCGHESLKDCSHNMRGNVYSPVQEVLMVQHLSNGGVYMYNLSDEEAEEYRAISRERYLAGYEHISPLEFMEIESWSY